IIRGDSLVRVLPTATSLNQTQSQLTMLAFLFFSGVHDELLRFSHSCRHRKGRMGYTRICSTG
ncbi:hypothetical protein, partial [Enterobacter kobei]|uniref:hypothetical protein n=1 Tax=Enterobacter kobei TaxID=208224 RepID=UPI001C63BC87